ncbi:hypothetical protein ABIC50_004041 [Burkholderia sp. 567]
MARPIGLARGDPISTNSPPFPPAPLVPTDDVTPSATGQNPFTNDAADVRPSSVARKAFEMTIRDRGTPPALHHVFEPR